MNRQVFGTPFTGVSAKQTERIVLPRALEGQSAWPDWKNPRRPADTGDTGFPFGEGRERLSQGDL